MSARVRQPSRPGGLTLPGVPELAGAGTQKLDLTETPPWQARPANWFGPTTEWACYWWLTEVRHLVEGRHFRRQVAVPAPGVFAGRDFTRVDFLFPLGGQTPASADGDYNYLAWDPYTLFTHPDRLLDLLKRQALANNDHPWRTALVWIEGETLLANPGEAETGLLADALRGRDLSARAKGW